MYVYLKNFFHKSSYAKKLDTYLAINPNDIDMYPEFNMTESITNTNVATEKIPGSYLALVQYVAGLCYVNGKLSNGSQLTCHDLHQTQILNELVYATKPMSIPLNLFHGFEPGINYGDNNWRVGDSVKLGFHLSKTPAIWIAKRFSYHFCWYLNQKNTFIPQFPMCEFLPWYAETACPPPFVNANDSTDAVDPIKDSINLSKLTFRAAFKTIFFQKYLFCIYPEPNKWSHVSTDIRCPSSLYQDASPATKEMMAAKEEYEYLSHTNEEFKLVDVVYKFNFSLPIVRKFYILERINE